MDELKKELSGHLEAGVLAMMRDPIEYDAFSLHRAMKVCATLGFPANGTVCLQLVSALWLYCSLLPLFSSRCTCELSVHVRI